MARSIETLSVHGGELRDKAHDSLVTPLILATAYPFENTDELHRYFRGEHIRGEEYGRYGNPTQRIAEDKLAALEGARIDDSFQIPDTELLPVLWQLIQREGLYLGASSAINVAGAMRLARQLGPGHTIVTLLCDSAARYESRLFNRGFLEARGLPPPPWLP